MMRQPHPHGLPFAFASERRLLKFAGPDEMKGPDAQAEQVRDKLAYIKDKPDGAELKKAVAQVIDDSVLTTEENQRLIREIEKALKQPLPPEITSPLRILHIARQAGYITDTDNDKYVAAMRSVQQKALPGKKIQIMDEGMGGKSFEILSNGRFRMPGSTEELPPDKFVAALKQSGNPDAVATALGVLVGGRKQLQEEYSRLDKQQRTKTAEYQQFATRNQYNFNAAARQVAEAYLRKIQGVANEKQQKYAEHMRLNDVVRQVEALLPKDGSGAQPTRTKEGKIKIMEDDAQPPQARPEKPQRRYTEEAATRIAAARDRDMAEQGRKEFAQTHMDIDGYFQQIGQVNLAIGKALENPGPGQTSSDKLVDITVALGRIERERKIRAENGAIWLSKLKLQDSFSPTGPTGRKFAFEQREEFLNKNEAEIVKKKQEIEAKQGPELERASVLEALQKEFHPLEYSVTVERDPQGSYVIKVGDRSARREPEIPFTCTARPDGGFTITQEQLKVNVDVNNNLGLVNNHRGLVKAIRKAMNERVIPPNKTEEEIQEGREKAGKEFGEALTKGLPGCLIRVARVANGPNYAVTVNDPSTGYTYDIVCNRRDDDKMYEVDNATLALTSGEISPARTAPLIIDAVNKHAAVVKEEAEQTWKAFQGELPAHVPEGITPRASGRTIFFSAGGADIGNVNFRRRGEGYVLNSPDFPDPVTVDSKNISLVTLLAQAARELGDLDRKRDALACVATAVKELQNEGWEATVDAKNPFVVVTEKPARMGVVVCAFVIRKQDTTFSVQAKSMKEPVPVGLYANAADAIRGMKTYRKTMLDAANTLPGAPPPFAPLGGSDGGKLDAKEAPAALTQDVRNGLDRGLSEALSGYRVDVRDAPQDCWVRIQRDTFECSFKIDQDASGKYVLTSGAIAVPKNQHGSIESVTRMIARLIKGTEKPAEKKPDVVPKSPYEIEMNILLNGVGKDILRGLPETAGKVSVNYKDGPYWSITFSASGLRRTVSFAKEDATDQYVIRAVDERGITQKRRIPRLSRGTDDATNAAREMCKFQDIEDCLFAQKGIASFLKSKYDVGAGSSPYNILELGVNTKRAGRAGWEKGFFAMNKKGFDWEIVNEEGKIIVVGDVSACADAIKKDIDAKKKKPDKKG